MVGKKKNFVFAILGEKEFLQVYFRHLEGALLHLEALSGPGLRVVGWYCARQLSISLSGRDMKCVQTLVCPLILALQTS